MKDDVFHDAINVLAGTEAPRVWSLIVTVFGDLAQRPEEMISGPVLGDILSPINVRPEAMRVALHRLRNDGWLEAKKRGREALHHLSVTGYEQSARASKRIYANAQDAEPDWHILCFPSVLSSDENTRSGSLQKDGYVAIAPGVYLANGTNTAPPSDALVLQGHLGPVPEWLSQTLVPSTLVCAFKDLSAALQLLDLGTDADDPFTPLQTATLRTLVVHRWRKLALKMPDVPDALFGSDFAGFDCRAQVMRTLSILPKPALSTLARSAL